MCISLDIHFGAFLDFLDMTRPKKVNPTLLKNIAECICVWVYFSFQMAQQKVIKGGQRQNFQIPCLGNLSLGYWVGP